MPEVGLDSVAEEPTRAADEASHHVVEFVVQSELSEKAVRDGHGEHFAVDEHAVAVEDDGLTMRFVCGGDGFCSFCDFRS